MWTRRSSCGMICRTRISAIRPRRCAATAASMSPITPRTRTASPRSWRKQSACRERGRPMSRVELRDVSKRFGQVEVLHNIDLDIAHGEFVVFVGPSGCGKSTLLRLICGLEPISGGQVLIDGKPMRGVPPSKRNVAMVFQSYALYPHMSVGANMGFSLRMAGVPPKEREVRVKKAAAILHLDALLD